MKAVRDAAEQLRDCLKSNPQGPHSFSSWQVKIIAELLEYSAQQAATTEAPPKFTSSNWPWKDASGAAPSTGLTLLAERDGLEIRAKKAEAEVERLKAVLKPLVQRASPYGEQDWTDGRAALASGPSGDTLYDFKADQWWLPELDAAVANGTHDQKRAVAVVRNLLATLENQPNATEFRKLLNKFAHACRYGDFEDRIEAGMAIEAAQALASGAAQKENT